MEAFKEVSLTQEDRPLSCTNSVNRNKLERDKLESMWYDPNESLAYASFLA